MLIQVLVIFVYTYFLIDVYVSNEIVFVIIYTVSYLVSS